MNLISMRVRVVAAAREGLALPHTRECANVLCLTVPVIVRGWWYVKRDFHCITGLFLDFRSASFRAHARADVSE